MGKTRSIPFKSGTQQGCPLFDILFEMLVRTVRQEKEMRGVLIGKEKVKLSLFAHDMIIYLKGARNSTRKLLETINSFSKVSGYKINLVGRQRQADPCEFKASLVYIVSSRPAGNKGRPCLKPPPQINLEKLVAFLYANNKQLEKEYKETFPLTVTSKK